MLAVFHTDIKTMPKGKAKKKLDQIIGARIRDITHVKQTGIEARPASMHDLTFDHATYDLWHDDFECSRYNVGDERWMKFFVRNIDYLFNNAIFMKNDEVVLCFLRE